MSRAPPPDHKPKAPDYGLGVGTRGKQFGALDILSSTQGVDFGPYLKEGSKDIRKNWFRLIANCAESLKGKLAIELSIVNVSGPAERGAVR